MEFGLPEIDVLPLSDQTDPVPMNNLLENNHQTPAITDGLTWPANVSTPTLSSSPIQSPKLSTNHHQRPTQPKLETNEDMLIEDPPIDQIEVNRMGGLAYADQCKERAREQCKDTRKKRHMASGNHGLVTRQKKGDNSVTEQDKKHRRLRKNQDSSNASRHAQKVYIHVLEQLVKNGEEEKDTLLLEVRQLREENSHLRQHNCTLTTGVSQLEEGNNNSNSNNLSYDLFAAVSEGRYDSLQVAKLIDMMTAPEQVSAQAQDRRFAEGRMGIQPSRAV